MHLSDFIGLKLHDISNEDNKLIFTFANNHRIVCNIEKGFYIKKDVFKELKQIEEENKEIKEAKADLNKRSNEIAKARSSGSKAVKKKTKKPVVASTATKKVAKNKVVEK